MRKANLIFRLFILMCCIGLPILCFAQPGPPDDTPIDGGLTLLLAAGAAYGVKRYRDSRKKDNSSGPAGDEMGK